MAQSGQNFYLRSMLWSGLPTNWTQLVASARPERGHNAALQHYASTVPVPNSLASVGGEPRDMGWPFKAVNHPAGKLAEYWVSSAVLWRDQQIEPPRKLNAEYRDALHAIINDDSVAGKLGRTVLASRFHYFLSADETWTLEHLLPLFAADHKEFQCVWEGFLTWGRLSPQIAEHLRNSLIGAVQRVSRDFEQDMLVHFMEFYIVALSWLIEDAHDEWVAEFFIHANGEGRRLFAWEVGHQLRNLDEAAQQEWWNIWLRDYWADRLRGVPVELDDAETAEMLEWVVNLPAVFTEAVNLAVQMRSVPLAHSLILHDLGESILINRYPNDLARLLVHIGRCQTDPWFWMGSREVVDRLLGSGPPVEIEQGLRELIAKHDLR